MRGPFDYCLLCCSPSCCLFLSGYVPRQVDGILGCSADIICYFARVNLFCFCGLSVLVDLNLVLLFASARFVSLVHYSFFSNSSYLSALNSYLYSTLCCPFVGPPAGYIHSYIEYTGLPANSNLLVPSSLGICAPDERILSFVSVSILFFVLRTVRVIFFFFGVRVYLVPGTYNILMD